MSEFTPNTGLPANRQERGAVHGLKTDSSDLSAVVRPYEFTEPTVGDPEFINVNECSIGNEGAPICTPWTGKRVVFYDSCSDLLCPRSPEEIAANTNSYVVSLWDDQQKCETKYQFINCGTDPVTGEPYTSWDAGQVTGLSTPGADADQTI